MQLPAVQTKFLNLPNSFSLRNGATLDKVCVAYEQYGTLTPEKDNAILLFHALSGSQHAYGYNPEVPGTGSLWKPENHEGWWNSIIGPGKPLDTDRFCIICANYLGGCYGTTGPASPCCSTARTARSNVAHIITREWVKCRGSPRISQMPLSGRSNCSAAYCTRCFSNGQENADSVNPASRPAESVTITSPTTSA